MIDEVHGAVDVAVHGHHPGLGKLLELAEIPSHG